MDIGAFDYEKEVILSDGAQLEIIEVKELVDKNNMKYVLITLDTNVIFWMRYKSIKILKCWAQIYFIF